MEQHLEKPLLVLLVLSCLLIVPLVSSVPMPRSLRLGSQQQYQPTLKLTPQEMEIAAKMDFEVNDYPAPGPNHAHDPGHRPHHPPLKTSH